VKLSYYCVPIAGCYSVAVSLSDFADSPAGFSSSNDVSFLAASELVAFLADAELLSTISSFGGM
jgi:hypothetical protein